MWRAGRNSPLKSPFRPARIFVDFFGNFCDESPRGTGGKNEGAVADQMGTHLLLLFIFKHKHNHTVRSGPLSLPWSLWRAIRTYIRTAPALPTVARATVGRVRHTDMCWARTTFSMKKRKSTASRWGLVRNYENIS